jgi:hypothetical protein
VPLRFNPFSRFDRLAGIDDVPTSAIPQSGQSRSAKARIRSGQPPPRVLEGAATGITTEPAVVGASPT